MVLAADLVLLQITLVELVAHQHLQHMVVMLVVQELVDQAVAPKLVVLDMLVAVLAYMAKVLVEMHF